jgi:hypothetical protein
MWLIAGLYNLTGPPRAFRGSSNPEIHFQQQVLSSLRSISSVTKARHNPPPWPDKAESSKYDEYFTSPGLTLALNKTSFTNRTPISLHKENALRFLLGEHFLLLKHIS